jgi:hypothetical protein
MPGFTQVSSERNRTVNPKDTDAVRRDHIQRAKDALISLGDPHLQLMNALQVREQLQRAGPLHVEASGVYGVEIDVRAISAIAEACGLTPEELKDVTVKFVEATLAERDFFGHPVGGITIGNTVEVYTAIPVDYGQRDNTDAALRSIKRSRVQLNTSTIVESLLHELRHVIQAKTNMFPHETEVSFMADTQLEHDTIPSEGDAIAFSRELVSLFKKYFRVRALTNLEPELFDHPPLTQDEKKQLQSLSDHIDLTAPVYRAVEKDPPGLYLQQRVEKLTKMGQIFDSTFMKNFVDAIALLQSRGGIGCYEQVYLLKKIKDQAELVGATDVKYIIEIELKGMHVQL